MQKLNVETLARLDVFSHAVVAGDFIFVSGTLGMAGTQLEVVPGGVAAETVQVLRNLERILAAAGATLEDVVKMTIYLANDDDFPAMNEAYRDVVGTRSPPARITTGRAGLHFGASIEVDCIAYKPRD
jgi:reactive intermediate/imine deaminase